MDMRVAAYAVITDDDGRVLLAHWNDPTYGAWTLPGGGLDDGEDPVDAARREVAEETGYDAEIGAVLGVDSQLIPAAHRLHNPERGPIHALRIVYRARITGGELRFEQDGSTDKAGWFRIEELADLPHVRLVDVALRLAGLID